MPMIPLWRDPEPISVPDDLQQLVGGRPLVAQLLMRRGYGDPAAARAFLDPAAYAPTAPTALPDMAAAVDRLHHALRHREPICVWGDFDVDGQTATTLLVAALRELGGEVRYHIPVRATESHGIKLPALQEELARGTRLLLTCDTGISEYAAVEYARQHGVDVLITDHHELPPQLPPANAILNPHRLPASHPLAPLPGVGVAYLLAAALLESAGRSTVVPAYLDLVALGIVADVAEVRGEARYLLQRGLQVLRTTSRLGLQELFRLARLLPDQINEDTIGFELAPRLNALGRLESAQWIVEFLTTDDLSQARIGASRLEALNARRKLLCDQVEQSALAQVEADPTLLESAVLVLTHAGWPAGIIGIVANRLVERYHRPVILLTAPPGEPARGSARSIPGCHITDYLAEQAALLTTFGGHALAAGLSLPAENIPALRQGLSKAVVAQGLAEQPPVVEIAAYLPLADLDLALAEDLQRLSPFGSGNPAPLLACREVHCVSARPLGREQAHLLVTVGDDAGAERQVVWWHARESDLPEDKFDLAYTVRVNTYRGVRDLQIVWEDARPSMPSVIAPPELPPLIVEDYRYEPRPLTLVRPLIGKPEIQIWAEGPGSADLGGCTRSRLAAASTLVIWTTPSTVDELARALAQVAPARVLMLAVDPGMDQSEPFLKQLSGLVKYALKNAGGVCQLEALCGATAHSEAVVRVGLQWLAARGYISWREEQGRLFLAAQSGAASEDLPRLTTQLDTLLKETAAYRHYLRRLPTDLLAGLLHELAVTALKSGAG